MHVKVFTSFSGYDSQCLALDRLAEQCPGFSYELVGWSEIDKYAIQAHNALYPQWADRNYGDISKIKWEETPDFDLFTYSFPCTDISNAGVQKGLSEGTGTRSSLLWECRKAISVKKPKFLMLENVKALCGKKFIDDFNKWLNELDDMGYTTYWQVVNATDFGVPQNRERVFCISIRNDVKMESDGSKDLGFEFPKPFPLTKKLKDVLEDKVDESYYISQDKVDEFISKPETKKKIEKALKSPLDGSMFDDKL